MKKMKNHAKYFSLLSLYFLLVSCKITEPKISDIINLNALDASCTEAWLQLKTQNLTYPAEITLTRNDKFIKKVTLQSADTVIYEESLLPSRTYNYQASIPSAISQSNNQSILSSNIVSVTTMDTTSHDFAWQTYTFGGTGGSSYLNDVAIIDENNIWAVGLIYENGKDYNAVHWNGEVWELKRIANDSYPRRIVYAFNENDVWFDGSIKWDGARYSVHNYGFPLDSNGNGWYRNAMWGTSSEDFYVVGNGGNIAHYRNGSWTKIESGTNRDIQDIWGTKNVITQEQELFFSIPTQYSVYKLDGQNNIKRLEIGDNSFFRGMWTKNGLKVYVAGFGIVSGILWNWTVEVEGDLLFFKDVKGDGNNNVFAAGANGEAAVFNGMRWSRYNEIKNNNILYNKVAVKGNITAAAGETFGNEISGIILIGRRH